MSKKMEKINKYYEKITTSNFNFFDLVLYGELDKCNFEGENLGELYSARFFNGSCQIGSLLCAIAFDNSDYKLVRGELLPNIKDAEFVHGWVETTFYGREYVIDAAMGRTIPKEEYYRKLRPRVDAVVTKKELLKNDYVRFLSEALHRENRLDMETLYKVWWPYEESYLINVDDNTLLDYSQFEKPAPRGRKPQSAESK